MKRAYVIAVLSIGVVPVLAHAFIPIEQFIHRGDDAFYYFKIALNHVAHGFWTFDGIHRTNGVQPLWGIILTAFAYPMTWLGFDDPNTAARIFVFLTALLHLATCAMLFVLLERRVSLGTAIAASGGLLFSMGIVWARVWGMENSLYALLLLATIHWYHERFTPSPSDRSAAILGVLIGLTALARLNAALFAPCLVIDYLARRGRVRFAAITTCAASALLLPYSFYNLATTGHLLPVSGAVKHVYTAQYLERIGAPSQASLEFVKHLFEQRETFVWLFTSRALDGLWALGSRLIFDGGTRARVFVPFVLLLLALPSLAGPRSWLAHLCDRLARFKPMLYVAVFAALNGAISIVLYPSQISYAMSRWWLVESELILTVLFAAILAAGAGLLARRFLPPAKIAPVALAAVTLLALIHTVESLRFYWQPARVHRDWNKSWNDESYLAARWMAEKLPRNARIGCWNAGVLGHYAIQPVTNLDGLVNDFDLIPYIRERRIGEYVLERKIEYLADLQPMMDLVRIAEQLELEEVYSHHSAFMARPYKIYRVLGPIRSRDSTPGRRSDHTSSIPPDRPPPAP